MGGVDHLVLDGDTNSNQGSGIRAATMHRVKGLLFSDTIVAGLRGAALVRPEGDASESDSRERSLIYVSAARAKVGQR